MNNQEYNAFKSSVLSDTTIKSKVIPLSRIGIVTSVVDGREMMSITDKEGRNRLFHIGTGVKNNLLGMLGLEKQMTSLLQQGVGAKGMALITKLLKSSLQKSGKEITVVINMAEKTIIDLIEKEKPFLSNKTFFELFENHTSDNTILKNASYQNGVIKITTIDDKFGFQLPNLKNEEYNLGMGFTNGISSGTYVAPYFYRLICTNGMVGEGEMEGFSAVLGGNDIEKVKAFIGKLRSLDFNNYDPSAFTDKVRVMMNTKASYNELRNMKRMVESLLPTPKVEKVNDLVLSNTVVNDFFPTYDIEIKYHRKGYDLNSDGYTQKHFATIKTELDCWELLNRLTDFGSHDYVPGIEQSAKIKMQTEAGKFMSKKSFDTNFLMPQFA